MFTLATLLSVAFASGQADAQVSTSPQYLHSQPYHGPVHGGDWGHDYWHSAPHVPNIAQLDEYADQLAKVARHLHEDAHKLSQDYEHSHSIEGYVDQVDRLQHHMHTILHEAAEQNRLSTGLLEHIKSDVRQAKSLFSRLYGELHHQGYDGARTNDFYAMAHMREVIVSEANPLIRQLETALYGFSHSSDIHHTYRRPLHSRWYGHHGYYPHH
ncbi:secreted protein [Rhodopirellula maiorica SM1]|uniref:Secreted protein n=2 Tax=Novipirellula TaxID=2795426 RepID=M5RN63_9BACT|nr:secreted protein [Rhodopirellula maiorica SM1]